MYKSILETDLNHLFRPSRMIEEMLNISRINAGKLSIQTVDSIYVS